MGFDLSIHRFFSPTEVSQLESGLPRLDEWSSAMLVPFTAQQLRHATVLWINDRWFLERQVDISRQEVRERVSNWLLDEFGYVVPQSEDPRDAFTNVTKTLHADRYGSSTGRTVHGGSGRVATVGCYQAKGIGVTPLVGAGGDSEHATGRCSVEEAIREAIFAEVAAAEFPHGAIPVVAILDTGLAAPLRRSIVIRPAVLRVAHAERAPLFTCSVTGYSSSQRDDVQRSRDVVRRWSFSGRTRQPPTDFVAPPVVELVRRIAEQVAFGQVHRLFSGGYFSSNLSADGALLDFGGMRALPNYVNARNLDAVVGFGDEMKIVNKLIESVGFYFKKYSPASDTPMSTAELRSQAQAAYAIAFRKECLRTWGVSEHAEPTSVDALMQSMQRYFSFQQKFHVNYQRGGVNEQYWIYENLVRNGSHAPTSGVEQRTLEAICTALHRHFESFPDRDERLLNAWSCAARYLLPRESLDRERLKQSIESHLVANRRSSPAREWIPALVRAAVGRGRRHWPKLPSDLTVLAHVSYEGSTALSCVEHVSRRRVYWLEGIRVHDRCRLFDSCVSFEHAGDLGAQFSGAHWTARVPVSSVNKGSFIQVPPMQVEYERPSSGRPWSAAES